MNNREQWGSEPGFILAASGSAVRLKYLEISSHGWSKWWAAFTVVYLICILIVGLPFFG